MASRDTRSCSLPVEAALLERARRPGQLHGPAELALDLLDELADLRGRGLGLLALDADQRRLVLLVGEPDLEHAVDEQRDADDRDEQADILAKQPAANLSVARESLFGVVTCGPRNSKIMGPYRIADRCHQRSFRGIRFPPSSWRRLGSFEALDCLIRSPRRRGRAVAVEW